MILEEAVASLVQICKCESSAEGIDAILGAFPCAVRSPVHNGELPLHIACENGAPVAVIATIIKAWPEAVKCMDTHGEIPLHSAVARREKSSVETVRLLLHEWSEGTRKASGYYRYTPLLKALLHNAKEDIIELLIEAWPASVEVVDKVGRKALLNAAMDYLCTRRASLVRILQV